MRTAFVYVPNGVIQPDWWPTGEGKSFTFNRTLKPLESVKQRVQVIGGLDHVNATAGPDGAGDQPRQRYILDGRPRPQDRRLRHSRGRFD